GVLLELRREGPPDPYRSLAHGPPRPSLAWLLSRCPLFRGTPDRGRWRLSRRRLRVLRRSRTAATQPPVVRRCRCELAQSRGDYLGDHGRLRRRASRQDYVT